ncbi:MAG: aminopeptidase P family protein [Thermoanaerobaculia bacterium]|nr:aminopeptidase P family protein [Thermoanaerobaculia bacterium]
MLRPPLDELDRLMREHAIDAVVVPLHETMHSAFRWMTRGANLTKGFAVRVAGRETLLIAYPMERDEAAASGLSWRGVADFDHDGIFRDAPDPPIAYGRFFDRILHDLHSGPRISIEGHAPLPLYLGIAHELEKLGWSVVRHAEDLIQLARKRKSDWEIAQIRSVGERTEQVIDGVREILRSRAGDLTIGDIKRFISAGIVRRGMIEDHETIVAQGRDAGVPHSRGDASAPFRESVPLVIDIFPADRATGYFFDLTRTFCVGPVPDELRRIHADVLDAFEKARDAMKPGTPASSYQTLVCNLFEARGYPTTRSNPGTTAGYVHALGHGVGLDLHERPSFSLAATNDDLVEVDDVLTIEPGLYFPDLDLGVRIEDTFVVREGGVETLCRGRYDLAP